MARRSQGKGRQGVQDLFLGLLVLLPIFLFYSCGPLGISNYFKESSANEQEPALPGDAVSYVEIGLIPKQGLFLNAEDLILRSYDITIAGCNPSTHEHFNKTHSTIPFIGSSTEERIALPADDPDCVLRLSKIVLDTDGSGSSPDSIYDSVDSPETAADRTSGGEILLTRSGTGGSGGPEVIKVSVTIDANTWDNNAPPAVNARIAYHLDQVVRSDYLVGEVQGTIGFNPPNLPVELFSVNNVVRPSGSVDGTYRLTLSCTAEILVTAPYYCGEMIGEDPTATITNNFAVCTLPANGPNAVSEDNLAANAESYCLLNTTVSTATTAYASRPNAGEEFPSSSSANTGKLRMETVKLVAASGRLDTIAATVTEIWVVLLVKVSATRYGYKYWRSAL